MLFQGRPDPLSYDGMVIRDENWDFTVIRFRLHGRGVRHSQTLAELRTVSKYRRPRILITVSGGDPRAVQK